MNWVNTVWPMISAACLTVAVIYFLAWMRATARKSYLLISLAAASVSAVGLLELAAMHAEYPAQYARMVRWAHIPIAITAICVIGFVRVQYNAGSRTLAMAAILTRLACLPANFLTGVNLNYDSIQSLASIRFLGTYVSVAEVTEPNPWMLLGSVNVLLIVVFLGHAIFQIAKRPASTDRMRALMVCSSILMFAVMANVWTQMLVHDHVEAPHLFAPAFLGVLLAMTYDLAGGFTLAEKLAHSLTKIKSNLSDTQRKMDQAVDAAGVGFWTWDMASDRIWLSPPACALIGVSCRETLGFADLLERLPSPDRETFLTAIGAANEQDEFHCEFRVTIAEGRYRWIAARGRVVAGDAGLFSLESVMVDITERKEAGAWFRFVVGAASGAQVVVASSGEVVLANQRAAAIFGCSVDELIGADVRALIPESAPGEEGAIPAHYEWQSLGPKGREMEVVGLRKIDGEAVPLDAILNVVSLGPDLFLLISLTNLSEKRRIEHEEVQQRDEMAHFSRVSLLATLSGSLAHELNQPLAAILANAQAARRLLDGQTPNLDEVRESLAAIAENDMRAAELIKRMRALLRKDNSELRPLDICNAVDEVLRLLRSDLLIRQVELKVEKEQTLALVMGDLIQIQQVILNLLMNACDSMAGQPPPRCILVRIGKVNGDRVQLAVSDQGSGIVAEELKKIFSPFYTSKREGLGLGLAVCKTIVVAHGGDIFAESEGVGKGTTISFRLPALYE